ncbi:hypothetical protein DFH94DRAFT_700772 [Russula ochroleuca]|uniref:Uncharacterized protein n=1 Tax=Russula ochroleuca TaxID=152965 RepID=A0A9P5N585_9AGAM|nr:hypothetical protein DFH94DRAFT_700772 [Russula ochroleuca]
MRSATISQQDYTVLRHILLEMSAPPVPSNVAEIAAPLLFGILWNWTLFGVLVVQLYVYSYNFPEDRKLLKLLVYGIFLLETLQTALTGADLYYWFASGFGNMDHLLDPYASVFDVIRENLPH